jgi:hypothetical protein
MKTLTIIAPDPDHQELYNRIFSGNFSLMMPREIPYDFEALSNGYLFQVANLVLIDLGKNGLELYRKLRAKYKDLPIFLMTGDLGVKDDKLFYIGNDFTKDQEAKNMLISFMNNL